MVTFSYGVSCFAPKGVHLLVLSLVAARWILKNTGGCFSTDFFFKFFFPIVRFCYLSHFLFTSLQCCACDVSKLMPSLTMFAPLRAFKVDLLKFNGIHKKHKCEKMRFRLLATCLPSVQPLQRVLQRRHTLRSIPQNKSSSSIQNLLSHAEKRKKNWIN